MNANVSKRLRDARQACRAIAGFTDGLTFGGYEESLLVRSAVERQLGILGEALKRARDDDPDLDGHIPEIRQILGLRNRVIHGYDAVDDEIVWDVAQSKLPVLDRRLAAALPNDA